MGDAAKPTLAEALFEEFLAQRDAGAPVDFAALCAAHAECAAALRALLAAHQILEGAMPGPILEPATDESAEELPDAFWQRVKDAGPRGTQYQIRGEIARGGMGVVLNVWDEHLRRRAAMKVMRGEKAGDSEAVARFLDEAQITSQLNHPGIVPVYEIGVRPDGGAFYTMRLVQGDTLRTVFDRVGTGQKGWTQLRAVGVLLKVCETMSYAHSKRVIHRDLKPANVMVGQFGEVHVLDWGLARVLGKDDRHDLRLQPDHSESAVRTERSDQTASEPDSPLVTCNGRVVGTPAYMAPEQAKGQIEQIGPHSDVYAVGAMLYHLITGEMPYVPPDARMSSHTILARVVYGPPRALRTFGRVAPAALMAICDKAMAREIGARYPDMRALAEDLRRYLEGRVVAAYETGTWAETRQWVRRNRGLAGALGAVVVVLLVGVVALFDALGSRARVQAVDAREREQLDAIEALAVSFRQACGGPAVFGG